MTPLARFNGTKTAGGSGLVAAGVTSWTAEVKDGGQSTIVTMLEFDLDRTKFLLRSAVAGGGGGLHGGLHSRTTFIFWWWTRGMWTTTKSVRTTM